MAPRCKYYGLTYTYTFNYVYMHNNSILPNVYTKSKDILLIYVVLLFIQGVNPGWKINFNAMSDHKFSCIDIEVIKGLSQ